MKKRVLSLLMSFVLLITLLPATVRAAETTSADKVYVTISAEGELKTSRLAVELSDLDRNEKLTVNDALIAAHNSAYEGGSTVGYGYYTGDYGLSMSKLWGDEGGAFGYYKNNNSCLSLADEVSAGDCITAFVYKDKSYYSDIYSYFDTEEKTVAVGESATLKLYYNTYDESYNAIPTALSGATVTVAGVEQTNKTDENGEITLTFPNAGSYTVSATKTVSTTAWDHRTSTSVNVDAVLVPPLCIVTVGTEEERANYQVVQDAKANLTWASMSNEEPTAVTVAPTLKSTLTVGEGENAKTVAVSWASTNSALSVNYSDEYGWSAYVDRPAAEDATGDLKATLVYANVSDTKVFPVTVKAEGVNENKQSVVSFKELMDNIAASYTSSTDAWTVLDMAGYGRNIKGESYSGDSAAPKQLAESAINGDSGTLLGALKTFDVDDASAIYTTPYVLLAYDAAEVVEDDTFTNTRAGMKASLVNYLNALDRNYADVDEVTPILAALAPYYSKGESDLDAAVNAGIAWLSEHQNSDGTFSYYGASNANSTALAVVALSALGIDAHRDSRFIKDGHSALEGLMSFALSTKNGFGYKGNVTKNALSTEQGFRALVSYARFAENSGKAYNIYLDAQVGKTAPADPQISTTVKPAPITPSDENTTVTVRVTVSGDTGVWLTKSVSAQSGVSVYDVLTAVLSENGYTWEGTSGYISYITHPNGTRLGEFSTGENSGWLYKVNGTLPSVGLGDYAIKNGDSIVFYYTNDWTRDPSAGSMVAPKEESSTLTPSAAVSNGTASVSVSAKDMSSALNAAKKNGEDTVTITPALKRSADTITVALPVSAVQQAAEQGAQLVIKTETARVVLSAETLSALTEGKSGTLKLEISTKNTEELSDTLPSEDLENAAVAEVTVTADGETVTSFGGKTLTVDIPVSSTQFYEDGHFRVLIISRDGTVEQTEGVCVKTNGNLSVRVETTHLSTFVVLPETVLPFADVGASAWYRDAVRFVYEKGLMTGVSDDSFLPDGTATRAQVVTILHRLAGSPVVDHLMQYSDVAEDAWYAEAVRWATSEGIVTGYSDDRFAPDDAVTREQLAAMLYRFVQKQGGGFTGMWYFPLRYDDAAEISAWANEAMHWCVMRGILNGTSSTTLEPAAGATRSQLAAILQRFDQLPADDEKTSAAQSAYNAAAAYLADTVSTPSVSSIGGEWTVLALTRGGADFNASAYLASLEKTLNESGGVLSSRKYTEYSRVILALTALGKDARSFAGYDLTLPLGDFDKTMAQGVNGAIFALLALDSGDYPMPEGGATRQMYIDAILSAQCIDGGWSLTGSSADPDLTAMALAALAPYQAQSEVGDTIDSALACLSAMQQTDGGFASGGVSNAESCAQVLLALCALEIGTDDARFVKNGHTVLDALLSYQTSSGGFRHIAGGDTNLMASEQAACALAALVRVERGETSFYAMNKIAARLAA